MNWVAHEPWTLCWQVWFWEQEPVTIILDWPTRPLYMIYETVYGPNSKDLPKTWEPAWMPDVT